MKRSEGERKMTIGSHPWAWNASGISVSERCFAAAGHRRCYIIVKGLKADNWGHPVTVLVKSSNHHWMNQSILLSLHPENG